MTFSDDEVYSMFKICKRLDPGMINSVQDYDKSQLLRKGCMIGMKNKYNKYYCIFQNFDTLSPARMRILDKIKSKVPYELHITYPTEGVIRLGWKCV